MCAEYDMFNQRLRKHVNSYKAIVHVTGTFSAFPASKF